LEIIYDKGAIVMSKYYIISLDNGIPSEEPIDIKVVNSFNDGTELVLLNDNIYGVIKTSAPDKKYLDDADIIKADIAELFDINHEEIRRVSTDREIVGNFTLLNYSKDIETRISATTILNNVINHINAGDIRDEDTSWVSETLRLSSNTNKAIIKDKDQIENIINLGIYSLIKDSEIESGMPLNNKVKITITKNYIRMILFDYIIGRKYRGFDYYLIANLNTQGLPDYSTVRFAPISVTNSYDNDSTLSDKVYYLNNCMIDREALINTLYDKYYYEIKKLSMAICDAKRIYKDAIDRIIYNNTDIDYANNLEDIISTSINKICTLENKLEKELFKEKKINKIERTMATQSLNVRVTTKLDLIQKKYPINPNEHPELLISNKKKKDDSGVNIKVEGELGNAGSASVMALLSVVALVCGLCTGIVIVLLTMGNL
jgi:hypothetical protein